MSEDASHTVIVPDLDDDVVHCFESHEKGSPGIVPLTVCADTILLKIVKHHLRLQRGVNSAHEQPPLGKREDDSW